MLTEGKYSVWFKTPIGDGAGLVELGPNGELTGCDPTFAYSGTWEQDGERFKADLAVKRVAPGPPGIFGMDEVDVFVTGRCDDATSATGKGFAKQSPGLELEVTLIRV